MPSQISIGGSKGTHIEPKSVKYKFFRPGPFEIYRLKVFIKNEKINLDSVKNDTFLTYIQ